jgi:hypothetical protein
MRRLQAFRALLQEDPEDARAARGLARVLNWSGRTQEADRAYARALEFEDDPEARSEWAALRARYPPSLASGFEFFEDSDGFQRIASSMEGVYHLDLATRLNARAVLIRLEAKPTPATLAFPQDDRGIEYRLGAHRKLGERFEGELELGGRSWDRASTRFLARARLAYTLPEQGLVALNVDHGDFLERSGSLAAVQAGIRDTTIGGSLWKGFGPKAEYWGQIQGSLLSDSNQRLAADTTLSWRPWVDRYLRLHPTAAALGYTRSSDLYYDPRADIGARLGLTHRIDLPLGLRFDFVAGGGFGYSKQDGQSGVGPAYDLEASLSCSLGRWRLAVGGGRRQSRRETIYTSNRATAHVGLDF